MIRWIGIGLIGLTGGLAGGVFGVGGGLIFVPLLVLFFNLDMHVAIGTSLAVIVPTALIGAVRHWNANSIDFKTAGVLALFAMVGAWLGSGLSLKLDVVLLRKIFAVFLFLVALRLFIKQ